MMWISKGLSTIFGGIMKKICLVTHKADADGAFPIILAKLIYDDLEVFSCEVSEVHAVFESILSRREEYDIIYVVDLCMDEEIADVINADEIFKKKIQVFDHHASRLFMNKYSFISVIDERNGKKECGTSLFYEYLKKISGNEILHKPILKTMIEYIREGDTYDFIEENKKEVFQFGSLYAIYGRVRYIEYFYDLVLNHDIFSFSETDKLLISLEEEKTKLYIDEKMEHVKYACISGVRVGIVFAEQRRSLLGHEMAEKLDIDIAIVINVDRSVSYRADKDYVDVSLLAIPNGGGGHKHAGGSPLPVGLQEQIVNLIFKEVEWL